MSFSTPQIMNCVKQLCRLNAGRHNMEQIGMGGFSTPRPPRQFPGSGGAFNTPRPPRQFGGIGGGPPPFKRMRPDDAPDGGNDGNNNLFDSCCVMHRNNDQSLIV